MTTYLPGQLKLLLRTAQRWTLSDWSCLLCSPLASVLSLSCVSLYSLAVFAMPCETKRSPFLV